MASGMTFVPNTAGIEKVFKSSSMQNALRSTCEPAAARANSNFALNACMIPAPFTRSGKAFYYNGDGPEIEPYGVVVDVASHTAIGKVVAMTALGRYDNSINNTIKKSR